MKETSACVQRFRRSKDDLIRYRENSIKLSMTICIMLVVTRITCNYFDFIMKRREIAIFSRTAFPGKLENIASVTGCEFSVARNVLKRCDIMKYTA